MLSIRNDDDVDRLYLKIQGKALIIHKRSNKLVARLKERKEPFSDRHFLYSRSKLLEHDIGKFLDKINNVDIEEIDCDAIEDYDATYRGLSAQLHELEYIEDTTDWR